VKKTLKTQTLRGFAFALSEENSQNPKPLGVLFKKLYKKDIQRVLLTLFYYLVRISLTESLHHWDDLKHH
jgi:hypothetical protein